MIESVIRVMKGLFDVIANAPTIPPYRPVNFYTICWTGKDNQFHTEYHEFDVMQLTNYVAFIKEAGAKHVTVYDEWDAPV